MTDARYSPLHQLHVDAGASFTDFAGWQMPVSYGSDLAEHHAVRTSAGIFDISHMAEISVSGTDAAAFLDYALAGKISAVAIGQAKYSLLLNAQGGIIDDLVVYRLGDTTFLIVANASNRVPVVAALHDRTTSFSDLELVDTSDDYALIAVQGPGSRSIVEDAIGVDLAALKYYWSMPAEFAAQPLLIGRTGYTGEDGFELYIATAHAAALWEALVGSGGDDLVPAGLASRDTLRLEAGMPLYGHELGTETLPMQAGLGRVVALAKEGDFVGRDAVEAGPNPEHRVLVGLVSEGKRAGRAGYSVYVAQPDGVAPEAEPVGEITSGALSPTLGYPIAMAYVDREVVEAGTALAIDVRGSRVAASIVPLPFYTRS